MSQLDHPQEWATTLDPMTDAQKSFLHVLCDKHNVKFEDSWGKGEASAKIEELKNKPMDENAPAKNVTEQHAATDDSHLNHPEEWATGGDDATGKQKGFVHILAQKHGKDIDTSNLKKAEASELIEELK